MFRVTYDRAIRFGIALSAMLAVTTLVGGCGVLDVSDPTAIEGSELENSAGAELVRGAAIQGMVSAGRAVLLGGLLTDEFFVDPLVYATGEELLDRRESLAYEQQVNGGAWLWHDVRRRTTLAIPQLRAYALPEAADAEIGEMYAFRGLATLRMAEDICPGVPLYGIVDLKPVYGPPMSTDELFEHALHDLDSAEAIAGDSVRVLDLALVVRGRALLGLGRFEEAMAATASVPTSYAFNVEYAAQDGLRNPLNSSIMMASGYIPFSVSDHEGNTGLDFVTAGDPRIVTSDLGFAGDGMTHRYGFNKYPSDAAPMVVASGIEARLIEAEAALNTSGDWLGMLNALRTSCVTAVGCPNPAPAGTGGVAGLPPLADPGAPDARVDLLFRERAFWLFATGHRLGDLRRLIARYNRSSESVFPTGPYRVGGAYGVATSIPFSPAVDAQYNPAVTGCTSR